MAYAGGIDLGGTKIEATVFDENWQLLHSRRIPTPKDDYATLVAAMKEQADWLMAQADNGNLPIGIGIPGLHNSNTDLALAANIPANGHPFRADVIAAIGRDVVFGNDCDMFALSEAVLGAGKGYHTVFGLIMGTGIGGGVCHDGQLFQTLNGAAGEVGHMAISAALVQKFNLPILDCDCGRQGCYETLAAGPGIEKLAKLVLGAKMSAPDIAANAAKGNEGETRVLQIWLRIIAELIGHLQCTVDPDCIILGGGLSNIPDVEKMILKVLPQTLLQGTALPLVSVAKYGDSSGTRGAALAALTGGVQ